MGTHTHADHTNKWGTGAAQTRRDWIETEWLLVNFVCQLKKKRENILKYKIKCLRGLTGAIQISDGAIAPPSPGVVPSLMGDDKERLGGMASDEGWQFGEKEQVVWPSTCLLWYKSLLGPEGKSLFFTLLSWLGMSKDGYSSSGRLSLFCYHWRTLLSHLFSPGNPVTTVRNWEFNPWPSPICEVTRLVYCTWQMSLSVDSRRFQSSESNLVNDDTQHFMTIQSALIKCHIQS